LTTNEGQDPQGVPTTSLTLKPQLVWQLKAMFALEFGALGCFLPLLSLYLKNGLQFSGMQIGWIQACTALTAIISPLLGATVTNRFLPARKVLALCHGLAALFMFILTQIEQFEAFLLVYLCYQICFSPTFALTNTIAFEHLNLERQHFGSIRVWGTLAWIAVSFLVAAGLSLPHLHIHHILFVSGFFSLATCGLALILSPPQNQVLALKRFFPAEAFNAVLRWENLRWGLLLFLISCGYQFHFVGMAPELQRLGWSSPHIPILMSTAQLAETFFMLYHRQWLVRFGQRRVMSFGATMMVIEFAIMASGGSMPWLLLALASHGITFACFTTTAIMVIDSQIDSSERGGVHQLVGLLSPGASSLFGGLTAGALLGQGSSFWCIPMFGAVIVTILCLSFREFKQS
jgi:MFS family permease